MRFRFPNRLLIYTPCRNREGITQRSDLVNTGSMEADMHICRMILVLPLLLTAACERQLATAPDQVPASGGAQLPLDPRQVQNAPGLAHASGHLHPTVELTPEMRQQLAALHPLFAKYHDQDKALEDGYEFVGPCVSDPALGGMGDHYSLNADDDFGRGDGTYALERPQYLVYAPQKNGRRRLAALDYTVPYEKWQRQEPPQFFGIPFTRNDGFGVWMFHIWLFQHNPAGAFANFNPTVPQC